MQVFVLDDEVGVLPRSGIVKALSSHTLTLATSCEDAKVKYKPPYDLLLLDHDMEGQFEDSSYHNTGYQFVVWLTSKLPSWDRTTPKPQVILHSQNPDGRREMAIILKAHGFRVTEFPFSPNYITMLRKVYET